jgi:amidase
MMNVLKSPFGKVEDRRLPRDYTDFLRKNALRGARIGIDRRQFLPEYFALPDINDVVEQAINAMADAGAEIIDPVDPGDPFDWFDPEFVVLMYEFKRDIKKYLRPLRHTDMRDLGDLIRFNRNHCEQEMQYFGQEIFEAANELSGDLDDREYRQARRICLEGKKALDAALKEHRLDAILSPSYAFGTSGPAVAGYPLLSVPVGISAEGRPAGVWLSGGFLSEPKLIALGYAIEQLLEARVPPQFEGTPPPPPPDAGICAALDTSEVRAGSAQAARELHAAARSGRARHRPTF